MTDGPTSSPRLTALIPALNEAATIQGVIDAARRAPEVHRVLVVDNGSTDGTARLAREAGADVVTCPTPGKAAAVRCGRTAILTSRGTTTDVLLLDGDLRGLTPGHIAALAQQVNTGAQMVCGVLWRSRVHRILLRVPIATFSGQRILPLLTFASLDLEDCEGYALEATISRQVSARRTRRVALRGVSHTRRERRSDRAWARLSPVPGSLAGPAMRVNVLLVFLGISSACRTSPRKRSLTPRLLRQQFALMLAWLSLRM